MSPLEHNKFIASPQFQDKLAEVKERAETLISGLRTTDLATPDGQLKGAQIQQQYQGMLMALDILTSDKEENNG